DVAPARTGGPADGRLRREQPDDDRSAPGSARRGDPRPGAALHRRLRRPRRERPARAAADGRRQADGGTGSAGNAATALPARPDVRRRAAPDRARYAAARSGVVQPSPSCPEPVNPTRKEEGAVITRREFLIRGAGGLAAAGVFGAFGEEAFAAATRFGATKA